MIFNKISECQAFKTTDKLSYNKLLNWFVITKIYCNWDGLCTEHGFEIQKKIYKTVSCVGCSQLSVTKPIYFLFCIKKPISGFSLHLPICETFRFY